MEELYERIMNVLLMGNSKMDNFMDISERFCKMGTIFKLNIRMEKELK